MSDEDQMDAVASGGFGFEWTKGWMGMKWTPLPAGRKGGGSTRNKTLPLECARFAAEAEAEEKAEVKAKAEEERAARGKGGGKGGAGGGGKKKKGR